MKQQWFTVRKLQPQLWAIAEFHHFEKTVMYLLVGQTRAILFDTGMGIRSIHRVIRTITKLPITIFLTHTHWDHIGGILPTDTVFAWKDLKDGQCVEIDGIKITVIFTPGHTPDSVCYFLKKKNWLFAGDTLYPGPLYAHLPESNISEYAKSLHQLTIKANSKTIIYPGHNGFSCNYGLLIEAAEKMQQAVHMKGKGIKKLDGAGFSILLS